MPPEKIMVRAPHGVPHRMVSEYINKCQAGLPALQTALEGSDFEYLRVYGHRLRGTGGAYGFSVLTEIGGSMEQGARERDEGELRKQVASLEAYLSRIEVVTG